MLIDGEVVGRVRSCAYAFTVARNVALATVPAHVGVGRPGDGRGARRADDGQVAEDVLYDPENVRVRRS